MNTPLKQIQQASDIFKCLNANPAYNEYNVWRQNMQSGRSYPISEQILDTVLEGDKSAFSILMDQMSFMDDSQKESIKAHFSHTENEALNNLKSELNDRGLLILR